MSKNNIKEILQKMRPQRPHYGIRKLSIGVASVLLSITIFAGEGAIVHADSQNNVNNPVQAGNISTNNDNTNQVVLLHDNETGSSAALQKGSLSSSATTDTSSAASAGKASDVQPAAEPSKPTTDEGDAEPSSPDQPSDPELVKEAKVLPQTTVQGELPALDPAAIVNHVYQELHNFGNDMSVEWVKKPDVSKVGKTTGTAQLKYVDADGKEQTLILPVEVDVFPGQKKAADEVRNTLNIVEKGSNKVIYRYTWTGKKDSSNSDLNDDSPLVDANMQLENEINYLGFEDDNSDYSHLRDAINDCKSFGEKDIVRTVVVVPVDQDAYNKHQVVLPDDNWLQSHSSAKTYANLGDHLSSPDQIRPAEFVYGLGYLGPDARVVWGVKPQYKVDPAEGSDVEQPDSLTITNQPSIEVIENGSVKQTIKGKELHDLLQAAFLNDLALVAGNHNLTTQSEIKIEKGGRMPDPISLIKSIPDYSKDADTPITDSQTIKDTLSKNFVGEWLLAPDVNQLGYQVAYYRIRPKKTTPETKNQIMQALFEATGNNETSLDQLRELLMNRAPYAVLVEVVNGSTPVQPPHDENGKVIISYYEKGNRPNVLATTSVSGIKGYPVDVATVIRNNVPVNWKLDPDYSVPATTTVYEGAQLWVPVVHDSKTINPDDPDASQDMFKTVTRTINVHKPDGSTQRTLQEVRFSRSKTVDAVTNTVISYGDWTLVAGSANDWAHFDVPQLSGYTSYVNGQVGTDVAEQAVTPDTADAVVEITYQPIDNQHHEDHGGQDKPTVPDNQHHDQGIKTPAVHHENQAINNSQPAQKMKVANQAQPVTREAQASKQLPQTGNENQAAIAGLGLVGLTLMLGLGQRKRRD